MLYKNLIVSAALFASGIHAMYENLPPTRGKRQAPEGMVMVHTVKVSDKDGNLKFSPESLQADPGSMVQFQFWPKVSISDPFYLHICIGTRKSNEDCCWAEPFRCAINFRQAVPTDQRIQA